MEITIRNSTMEDLEAIKELFSISREVMIATGNPNQWGADKPSVELTINDIKNHNSYVCIENGKIVGTFSLIFGDDPTYENIYHGAWSSDHPYATIHRVASDGITRGVGRACFNFSKGKYPYLRVDTHQDNKAMIKSISRAGFKNCGIIFVADGSPRIAFDFLKN